MKQSYIFTFIISFSFVFSGCNKKEDDPLPEIPLPTGTVEIIINPMFGEDTLRLGDLYTSPAGEDLRVHKLKFFVSEIVLESMNNIENKAISDTNKEGVFLVDFTKPNSGAELNKSYKLAFKASPGLYKDLLFNIGVPRKLNVSDPTTAEAPLNMAQEDMYWSWNSGYIFLLAEGNAPGLEDSSYHLGIGEEKRTMPFSFSDNFNPTPLISVQEGKTTRIIIDFDFRNLLINADGSNYSFSSPKAASVHGGHNADLISANAANTMKFISATLLPYS